MYDEEISEISKTDLQKKGRAKAGANKRGTESVTLSLCKEKKVLQNQRISKFCRK